MKHRITSAALAMCVLLSGCSSSEKKPDTSAAMEDLVSVATTSATSTGDAAQQTSSVPDKPADEPAETTVSTTAASTTTAVQIPTAAVTTTPDADSDFDIFYSEVHEQFDLSEEELSFVDYSLFVGDSICSGFAEYGIVPREHVAAKGNLGSRSFFDYTFKFRGKEDQTYEQVLSAGKPRYVLLSMGMNDVNMVYEDTYCENYRKVIQATLDGSDADVFVAAITPVCSAFCANSVIDSFNDYMRRFIEKEFPERVHFVDFGQYLKNDEGKLRTCLHSGDGVHLAPYCYYIALWEMHRALMEAGLWDGTKPTDGAEPMPPVEKTSESSSTTKPEIVEPEEKPEQTTSAAAKTTKPQTEKSTAKTTAKTTKPKPSKTTAEPAESEPEETTTSNTPPPGFEIPVE